jgi:hypothetical protein
MLLQQFFVSKNAHKSYIDGVYKIQSYILKEKG